MEMDVFFMDKGSRYTCRQQKKEVIEGVMRRRWGWYLGRNKKVLEEVLQDSKEVAMFAIPNEGRGLESNHFTSLMS